MSNGRGKHKSRGRKRDKKVSKGIGGATRHRLSEVQKVILGKGIYDSFAPIGSFDHSQGRDQQRRAA